MFKYKVGFHSKPENTQYDMTLDTKTGLLIFILEWFKRSYESPMFVQTQYEVILIPIGCFQIPGSQEKTLVHVKTIR